MLQTEYSRYILNKCLRQMLSLPEAAELLERTKQRAVAVYLSRFTFSNLIYLARFRGEQRKNDIFAGFFRKSYDLTDTCSWIPTPDNESKTQFKDNALSVDREDGLGINHPLLAGIVSPAPVPAIWQLDSFKGEGAIALSKNRKLNT